MPPANPPYELRGKKNQVETSRISQITQVPSLLQEPLDR
jgi:hypothetical protein